MRPSAAGSRQERGREAADKRKVLIAKRCLCPQAGTPLLTAPRQPLDARSRLSKDSCLVVSFC